MHKNILILLLIILTGCSQKRENKEIDASFFTKPTSVLITETTDFKTPSYHVQIDQSYNQFGLIGGLIGGIAQGIANSANHEAASAVQAMDISPIITENYYKSFKESLESRGLATNTLSAPLLLKELAATENDHKFAPFDVRFLKTHHNVDYALILCPVTVGITRFPGLFGSSIRNINLSFYLVNLCDNSIVGYYNAELNETMTEEWDIPPNYVPLTKGLEKTLAKAFEQAHQFFFKTSITKE